MTGVIKWACGSGVFVGILVVTFTALAAPDLHAVRERFDRGAELESQAVELFGNGDPQEAKKRLTQALKIYRQILREDPSDRDVPLRIGAILVHDNRCADVLPILSKSALDAYGVEVETLASMDRKQLNAKTKLAELAVLIGQCRLVNGPDRIGFDILEGLNSLPTDVHYLLGRRLREVAQNEQALHHLEVYLRQRPHDLRTKLVVANLQLKIGLLDDAEAMYLAILKHQPNDLAALKNLGIVQVRQKNYAVAQETLRKVIVAAPNDVAARFNLAAVLARLGKHSLAVTELRKVTSLTSCLARAWHKIGESLNALSQHSSAVIAFSEAIACDKKNAVSYAALGRLYNKINQNHQCINVTSLGHKINPEKPEILLVKGVCARDLGRLDEALDIHLRAESMNPGEPTVLLELSTDYILLHQFRDAVAVLRKVPQSARRLAQALDLLGCDQLQKRDVKLAIKSLAEAVQLAPKNPQIAVNFGVAWLTKGETTKASEIFRSVLQEQPTNLSAQIALSQILLRRSRYGRVIRRLSPLEEQIESSGPGSYVLGLAYLRARKASSAVMHLKNAEILLPNQLEIKLHLAQAWILNGQYNEAWDKLKNIDTASLSMGAKQLWELLLAYSSYMTENYSQAIIILEDDAGKSNVYNRLVAAIWQEAGINFVEQGRFGEALRAFSNSEKLRPNLQIEANIASAEYLMGNSERAYISWKRILAKQKIPEIFHNIAVYFDDVKLDEARAYRWYRRYARTEAGKKWPQRSKTLRRKRQWFGF